MDLKAQRRTCLPRWTPTFLARPPRSVHTDGLAAGAHGSVPGNERPSTRLLVFASPLMPLWGLTVFRALRWHGLATCARTGWLTRENVEVNADAAGPSLSASRRAAPAAAPQTFD